MHTLNSPSGLRRKLRALGMAFPLPCCCEGAGSGGEGERAAPAAAVVMPPEPAAGTEGCPATCELSPEVVLVEAAALERAMRALTSGVGT